VADQYQRPYIDTSVFLGWKNREVINGTDRYAIFQHIWQKAEAGEFKIFISPLVIAETFKLRHQSHTQPLPTITDLLQDFEREFVESIEIDREIGMESNALCRRFAANKLYPNDAVHLACALRAKCDVLLAWDRPLNSVAHPNIRIEEPEIRGQMTMTAM
jgi:predicted nucleic acid-binding protein